MILSSFVSTIAFFFFFNDTATTEIYTLSLHDALPILLLKPQAAALPHFQPSNVVRPTAHRFCRKRSMLRSWILPSTRLCRAENRVDGLHIAQCIFERNRDFGIFADGP